ncbi:MAG: amidase, partial [Pseudomonadota bacterium]
MKTQLHELTIAAAAELIRNRRLSPVELTQSLLQRIDRFDARVNAFITLTAELALEQAREAEGEIGCSRWRGPLHGIPYGLKDIFNTAGIVTTGHSRVGAQHVPSEDATVTAKLKAAGAVLMGKLATYQFTHGGPSFDPPWPPARNPWNTEHDAGGSSSGSAAAVAAGFVFGAMGSDTGGSVRIPASFCGLVGLRPTFGLVSRHGVIPNSFSFDHCGPLAWTADDCAIMLQAIAGFDPADPSSVDESLPDYRRALGRDLRGVRIGVLRHFWEEDIRVSNEVCVAMEEAIGVLRGLGARIEDARLRPLQDYYDVKNVITKSEVFCVHQRDLGERAMEFGPDFLGTTLGGSLFQSIDYVQAQRERTRMMEEMNGLYRRFDVLLAANAGPAPKLAWKSPVEFWQARSAPGSMCIPFSITGGPALSVCNGFARSGLPLGMQIAGRPFDESIVLRVG